jgi:hypothetical protein
MDPAFIKRCGISGIREELLARPPCVAALPVESAAPAERYCNHTHPTAQCTNRPHTPPTSSCVLVKDDVTGYPPTWSPYDDGTSHCWRTYSQWLTSVMTRTSRLYWAYWRCLHWWGEVSHEPAIQVQRTMTYIIHTYIHTHIHTYKQDTLSQIMTLLTHLVFSMFSYLTSVSSLCFFDLIVKGSLLQVSTFR